ncbi:hypothetical protein C3489_13235 [Streptomyces sp. Ru71]|uniref:DUF4232 domain-containing protein n=1 Tax=Streptomyces sp. Ru71 TaxID=2080746 RepID=UPI000CDE51B3|nr:DUF4232 domain-containing protein [Streptomyces sp. Ru71]POX54510.1 hypothetical protein C3489_13235 [Streptomyces sp. Ru71]
MALYPRFPLRLVSALAALGALTACGGGDGGGTAASTTRQPPAATATGSAQPDTTTPPGATEPAGTGTPGGARPTEAPAASGATKPASSRCRTGELRASVGRNNPGAGQENFPVVLTNTSARSCTVYGFPGAAFVDGSGRQLGADPRRESGSAPARVTLAPGRSAWAGLTFSNPEISEARTATPAALLVTPPDEREPLKVPWQGGPVPVGGNASTVFLTALAPGTGA